MPTKFINKTHEELKCALNGVRIISFFLKSMNFFDEKSMLLYFLNIIITHTFLTVKICKNVFIYSRMH
jgi:hypothetical protein